VVKWVSGRVTDRRDSPLRLRTSAICILLLLSTCAPTPRPSSLTPRPELPTTELRIKDARVFAEVVSKPEDRNLGLMFRRSLAPDSGMLFVFDTDDFQRFWMKNTLIPLSIAFVTRDSLITDILEMAPLDTTTPYLSSKAVRYAIEMNSGWFQTHGLKPGDTVRGLPPH
jgi:uncharacterized membrane protein (UPF0127 family)